MNTLKIKYSTKEFKQLIHESIYDGLMNASHNTGLLIFVTTIHLHIRENTALLYKLKSKLYAVIIVHAANNFKDDTCKG